MKIFTMPRNHGTDVPRQIVVLHVEPKTQTLNDSKKGRIKTLGYVLAKSFVYEKGKSTRVEVWSPEYDVPFWKWLDSFQSPRRTLWVFGCDLGRQLTYLDWWKEIEEGRYKCGEVKPEEAPNLMRGKRSFRGKMVVDGLPFFASTLGTHGRVRWIDTLNYMPIGVYEMADLYDRTPGLEQLKDCDFGDIVHRCMVGVDAVKSMLVDLFKRWEKEDCGVFQPTAAMLALTSFRHTLSSPGEGDFDKTIHFDERVDWIELEKQSYHGGQTEAYFVGKCTFDPSDNMNMTGSKLYNHTDATSGPYYRVDVNSLYPSVMYDHQFPVKRFRQYRNISPQFLEALLRNHCAIARVKISDYTHPHLLMRDGYQYHCCGEFWTTLAGPELQYALKLGSIKECGLVQTYVSGNPFQAWVQKWWNQRVDAKKNGDTGHDVFCKMILTALSGKFSQSNKRWKDMPNAPILQQWGIRHVVIDDPDLEKRRYEKWRFIAGHPQIEEEGNPPWYYFPAISSYICSYGRVVMRRLREMLPEKSVFYQCVDGLIISRLAYEELEKWDKIDYYGLGHLKVDGPYNEIEIEGPNHYRLDDKWTRAGLQWQVDAKGDGHWKAYGSETVTQVIQHKPDGHIYEWCSDTVKYDPNIRRHKCVNGWTTPLYVHNGTLYQDWESVPS